MLASFIHWYCAKRAFAFQLFQFETANFWNINGSAPSELSLRMFNNTILSSAARVLTIKVISECVCVAPLHFFYHNRKPQQHLWTFTMGTYSGSILINFPGYTRYNEIDLNSTIKLEWAVNKTIHLFGSRGREGENGSGKWEVRRDFI